MAGCKDCKGTGRIELLTSTVDCYCITKTTPKTCENCFYEYCECDGTCNEDDGESCCRCETWTCGYCIIDGMCGNCFSKLQGGVV